MIQFEIKSEGEIQADAENWRRLAEFPTVASLELPFGHVSIARDVGNSHTMSGPGIDVLFHDGEVFRPPVSIPEAGAPEAVTVAMQMIAQRLNELAKLVLDEIGRVGL